MDAATRYNDCRRGGVKIARNTSGVNESGHIS